MRTMAASVTDLRGYRFLREEELFLDANIWVFVFGPQRPGNVRVAAYSSAFSQMLSQNCRIYIDVLVLSEFINTYARLRWRTGGGLKSDFKQFRQSQDFKPLARDIAEDTQRLMKHCIQIDDGFESLDISSLIAEYAAGDSDFNDQVIASLCERRRFKLVTDDGDFAGQGISVLTANRRLLG